MRRAASAVLVLLLLGPMAPSAVAQDVAPPDICLTVGRPRDEAATSAIAQAVEDALAQRPVLIPEPATSVVAAGSVTPVDVIHLLVWTDGPVPGASSYEAVAAACGVGRPAGSWSAVIRGEFLRAGTKRELAAAPTTPGFSSSIDVEWDEAAELRAHGADVLGPARHPQRHLLDGRCRVRRWPGRHPRRDDDRVADEPVRRRGLRALRGVPSPNGGAGAQALVLLPREIDAPRRDGRCAFASMTSMSATTRSI